METAKSMQSFARNLILGCLLVSIISLVCFGILGIGRGGGSSNFDGAILYAAGRAWLNGLNPYEHANLVKSVQGTGIGLDGIVFFYPPQSSAICVLLGLFNYPIAKLIWLSMNIAAIAGIIAMSVKTISQHTEPVFGKLSGLFMSAVIIGNPFTTHVFWMGQTSIFALASTLAAWFFSEKGKWLPAGIFLGIATFKPQFAFLLTLWFLFQREWKILLTSFVTVCILSLVPIVKSGPIGALMAWQVGVSEGYSGLIFNTPGFQHKVGVQSLFAAAGISIPSLLPLAIGLVIFLWLFRNKLNDTKHIFSILVAITLTFLGYGHDYDYVFLIPVLTSICLCCYTVPKLWLSAVPLTFLLFVPQRLFRILDIPVLNHWRTMIVLIFLIILTWFSFTAEKTDQKPVGQPALD